MTLMPVLHGICRFIILHMQSGIYCQIGTLRMTRSGVIFGKLTLGQVMNDINVSVTWNTCRFIILHMQSGIYSQI